MACPKCKNLGPFVIGLHTVGLVRDDGVDETADHEWGDKSYCRCFQCEHAGIVADFYIKEGKKK
jgi:hypothetical protein